MLAKQGFFSIIQYCPDRERAEGVNVGVVLVCPDMSAVRVRMSESNSDVCARLGMAAFDDRQLARAKRALKNRLEALAPSSDREALEEFIGRESGQLVFVPPRSMRVVDPDADVAELFALLVRSRRRQAASWRDCSTCGGSSGTGST